MSRYSNKERQASFTFRQLRQLINYITPWLTTGIEIEDKEETHNLIRIKEADGHLIYFIFDNQQLFERLCSFKSKKKHTVIAYFSVNHYSQITMRDKGRELGHTVYLIDVPKNYRRKAKYYAAIFNTNRDKRRSISIAEQSNKQC